jgi:hypothetical protein
MFRPYFYSFYSLENNDTKLFAENGLMVIENSILLFTYKYVLIMDILSMHDR